MEDDVIVLPAHKGVRLVGEIYHEGAVILVLVVSQEVYRSLRDAGTGLKTWADDTVAGPDTFTLADGLFPGQCSEEDEER